MLKKLILIIIIALALLLPQAEVGAQPLPPPHEDPEAAEMVFSAASLLGYYSSSMDPVLERDPAAADAALVKMPFANLPPDLEEPSALFAAQGRALAQTLTRLFAVWEAENALLERFQLDAAALLANQIAAELPLARDQLAGLRRGVELTGGYLDITRLSPDNALKATYAQVLEKLDRLAEMLALLDRPLLDDDLLALLGNIDPDSWRDLLRPTALTFAVTPRSAFVGENVAFSGRLTSQGLPLADREIEVLLDSTLSAVVRTDSSGAFQGKFTLPYRYRPQMEARALYYPAGDDLGSYLGSASPAVSLDILYYEAQLVLRVDGPACPGLPAPLTGSFDYGPAPHPTPRPVTLYLDDSPVHGLSAGLIFDYALPLPPTFPAGQHTLMAAVPADGRYAPVTAACLFEVALAPLTLDLDVPRLAWLPGELVLTGRAYSALGPAQDAVLTAESRGRRVEAVSGEDGTFEVRLPQSPGLDLLGAQSLDLSVEPLEPWHSPARARRSVFAVNLVSCGLLLIVFLLVGFYLPRRLGKWYGLRSGRRSSPAVLPPPPVASSSAPPALGQTAPSSPPLPLDWYRRALSLVQRLTRSALQPHQTLREYSREIAARLGPVGKYFLELTLLVEKLLYSPHPPSAEDESRARQLAETIETEAGHENV